MRAGGQTSAARALLRSGTFSRLTVGGVAVREGEQHSEHHEARNQAESSVADERQGYARHRQGARNAAHIDQCLKADERRQADDAQF